MQDFEVPRYEAACAAFQQAFDDGLADGVRALEATEADRPADRLPFYLDVPLNDVLDDVWQRYVAVFRAAGRKAALAKRDRPAALDPHDARPDGELAFAKRLLRWTVVERLSA